MLAGGHWCTAGRVVPVSCLHPAALNFLSHTTRLQRRRLSADNVCHPASQCGIGFYNEHTGNDTQIACKRCPEHSSTNKTASVSIDDCLCQSGFEEERRDDGSRSCVCSPGLGLSVQGGIESCQLCPIGSYKAGRGNAKCENCPLTSQVTTSLGAVSLAACVCQAGLYFEGENEFNGTCSTCPEEGTNCTSPGVRLESLPLRQGYWRSMLTSVEVRRCYYSGACRGGSNFSAYCTEGHYGPCKSWELELAPIGIPPSYQCAPDRCATCFT